MLKDLNKKKWYKIVLTQEGEQKYHLMFLAFGGLPMSDVVTWSTLVTKAGDRHIVKRVYCTGKQLVVIKQSLGDFIVNIEEV